MTTGERPSVTRTLRTLVEGSDLRTFCGGHRESDILSVVWYDVSEVSCLFLDREGEGNEGNDRKPWTKEEIEFPYRTSRQDGSEAKQAQHRASRKEKKR